MPGSFPFSPTSKLLGSVSVIATTKGSPTVVETVLKAQAASTLVGLTVGNESTSSTQVQCWVGVRRQGDTGATWQTLLPSKLAGGEADTWSGRFPLNPGDVVVCYAGTTAIFTVTPEIEL